MSYTLEGREVPDAPPGREVGRAPCIFCGREIGHWNDVNEDEPAENASNVGWLLGAIVNGETKYFLYCDQPPCQQVKTEGYDKDIWRCGCVSDYVENVGDACHACRRLRADAVPVPD